MDSPEHGGNSSSPNADISILSAKWGTAESCVKLGLSNGSSFFVLIVSYDSRRFREGAVLCEDDLAFLEEADSEYRAWRKALDLIARREHSSGELKVKLLQRGYGQAAIDNVSTILRAEGLLNDERFAMMYAENRMRRKPEGSLLLEQRLRAKGISAAVAKTVISELYTPDAVAEAIARLVERLRRTKGDDTLMLQHELKRRGFSYQDISSYFTGTDD